MSNKGWDRSVTVNDGNESYTIEYTIHSYNRPSDGWNFPDEAGEYEILAIVDSCDMNVLHNEDIYRFCDDYIMTHYECLEPHGDDYEGYDG